MTVLCFFLWGEQGLDLTFKEKFYDRCTVLVTDPRFEQLYSRRDRAPHHVHRCAWIFTEGRSEIAHTIYRRVVEKTQIVKCTYGSTYLHIYTEI